MSAPPWPTCHRWNEAALVMTAVEGAPYDEAGLGARDHARCIARGRESRPNEAGARLMEPSRVDRILEEWARRLRPRPPPGDVAAPLGRDRRSIRCDAGRRRPGRGRARHRGGRHGPDRSERRYRRPSRAHRRPRRPTPTAEPIADADRHHPRRRRPRPRRPLRPRRPTPTPTPAPTAVRAIRARWPPGSRPGRARPVTGSPTSS